MWEHPVSLIAVYAGFYLAIVFVSLSIGELPTPGGPQRQPALPHNRRGLSLAEWLERADPSGSASVEQGCRRSLNRPPAATPVHAACGLYYLGELCEEYVLTTKRLISHTIKAELLLHALLLIDRLPPLCLLAGVAAHLSYLRLLKPFPYVQLTSGATLTSIGLLASSLVLWVRHYWKTYYTSA